MTKAISGDVFQPWFVAWVCHMYNHCHLLESHCHEKCNTVYFVVKQDNVFCSGHQINICFKVWLSVHALEVGGGGVDDSRCVHVCMVVFCTCGLLCAAI